MAGILASKHEFMDFLHHVLFQYATINVNNVGLHDYAKTFTEIPGIVFCATFRQTVIQNNTEGAVNLKNCDSFGF